MERLVDATTPLGAALWFRQMNGTEALSVPFEYDIIFHSKSIGLSAKSMLGKDVTLKVETEGGGGVRHFNGICTRFQSGGRDGEHLIYTAKLRPWLWLASRRSDCKIFQFKKVPDIIKDVLGKYGFPISDKLKKSYREWDYCVQYQETDMNFVMRLMEHEGIYFYFEHSAGVHTLVMCDDVTCHSALPGKSSIKYLGLDAATVADEEHFDSWQIREEVDPGEYITDDYDFEKPRADLKTKRKNPLGHTNDSWERYMWPGGYTQVGDGENYAGVRIDSLEAEHERATGHTTVRTMAPGYLYSLERCPRPDQNREYLSVAATFYFKDSARKSAGSGAGDSDWSITVTSQPTSIPYRPQRLTSKPLTHGPQTAVIVGPKGEEIYTDKYGRVKVQFHWDRYGEKNERSSCWIRVSHPWAGSNYGAIHIPRIGQEVIVDFLNGDPDYPMITGRVYNADQMPPWALPDNKTQSGILTRSSKAGAPGAGMKAAVGDANAIRFEDLKGKEQLWLHAQKDQLTEVENDEDKWVGRDRRKVVDRDEFNTIHRDRTEIVDRNEKINVHGWRTEEVDLDETITIHKNRKERVDLNESVDIGINQNFTVGKTRTKKVGANEVDKIGKNWSIKVGRFKTETIALASLQNVGLARMENVGAGYNLNVGAVMATVVGMSQFEKIGKNKSVNVGKTFKLEAGESIELIVGKSVLVMKKDGTVTLNGKDIDIVGEKHIQLDSKRIDLN